LRQKISNNQNAETQNQDEHSSVWKRSNLADNFSDDSWTTNLVYFTNQLTIIYCLTQLNKYVTLSLIYQNHNMFRPFYLVIIRWYKCLSSALLNCKMLSLLTWAIFTIITVL
jgi:hypothetical protein